MAIISQDNNVCTLINVYTIDPERQQELLDLLIDATEQVMKKLPGFVSANFHKSLDGTRVSNYAQWESKETLEAMLQHPEAQGHIKACLNMVQNMDYHLYTVEYGVTGGQ